MRRTQLAFVENGIFRDHAGDRGLCLAAISTVAGGGTAPCGARVIRVECRHNLSIRRYHVRSFFPSVNFDSLLSVAAKGGGKAPRFSFFSRFAFWMGLFCSL